MNIHEQGCRITGPINLLRLGIVTCISLSPRAFPMVVAVRSLPPLPNVVTAQDFQPCMAQDELQ